MKKRKQLLLVMVCTLMIGFVHSSLAQTTDKKTDKWYKSLVWLNGLKRTPAGTINKAEFAKQYQANKARWDLAFKYLKETDLSALKPGRYPLDGDDVYINVTEGPSKGKDEVMFECHKNYADIHCVISGKEMIGIAPYSTAVIKKEYDPAKDIAFYSAKGKYYLSDPSTIFILFPEKDAHCGGIKVKEPETVKKIVVKVRTS
ncbi:MAG: YhcH/YjgK/YiaL family protein [Bacteroidota bacterium]